MKNLFLVFLFGLNGSVSLAGTTDSVIVYHMKEVQILRPRFDYYTEGQRVINLSDDLIQLGKSHSLGELLSLGGQVFIKSYGSQGALSTISMRGTGSNETQVTWNGFPLNSVTSGDADLSLIPVRLADDITIHPGASGSLFGSGTFGGSLDIHSQAPANTALSFNLDAEMGSFHSRYLSAGVKQGSEKFGYSLTVALQNVENDYSYPDFYKPGSPNTVLSHNQMNYYGIYQSIFYSPKPRSRFEAGIWYQRKLKDMPEIMGSYGTSFASQTDSSLRVFGKWTRVFSHSSITIKSAYFYDYLRYTDKSNPSEIGYSINSEIFSRQYLADASFRNYFSEHITGEIGLVTQLIQADISAYSHSMLEPRYAFYAASKLCWNPLTINLSIRDEINPGRRPKPIPSLGASLELIHDQLFLRFSTAGKYRLPTLNEKYWQPGGNPDINPEAGWTHEGGALFKIIKEDNLVFSIDAGVFSTRIRNLIQWTGSGTDLVPVNFKDIWSRGLETQMDMTYTENGLKLKSELGINHIRSTNTAVYKGFENVLNKQLRYVPVNTAQWMTSLNYSLASVGFIYTFTDKTYITEDNTGLALSYHGISNVFITLGKPVKGVDLQICFRITNIFNKHYQVIASYPAPGRAFYLAFSFGFYSKSKSKFNSAEE